MPKSSKKFVLSDSRLNTHGFRMLTKGADLEGFRENPVLLFNHSRPFRESKDVILPMGHWEDIEIEGDKITGVPFFDDKDKFAMKIYHKVEAGHLRMCSMGADPIEWSEDVNDMLPGQKLATATKWKAVECSIVDIGANPGSLASDIALYHNGALITLSADSISNIIPTIEMSEKEKAVNKSAENKEASKEAEVKLSADIENRLAKLESDNKELKEENARLKLDSEKSEAEAVVNLAKTEGKITEAQVPHFVKLAMVDMESTKKLIENMPKHVSLRDRIVGGGNPSADESKLKKLSDKSFDDLWKENKGKDLQWLKLNAPDVYAEKYEEKHGHKPNQ